VLISLLSVKGSPGVTTAVLGLAAYWPRSAIALDMDPQGGDMLVGLGGGRAPAAHGIADVIVEARRSDLVSSMRRHVIEPADHGPLLLAGFGSLGQADGITWSPIAADLADLPGADVLADCGRFVLDHPINAVLPPSAAVVVLVEASMRSLRAAARAMPLIREVSPTPVGIVVVGPERPFRAAEIARACDAPVLGTLPHDPVSAASWTDAVEPGRRFPKAPLQRALADLAGRVHRFASDASAAPVGKRVR
jgi:hypothetical protein